VSATGRGVRSEKRSVTSRMTMMRRGRIMQTELIWAHEPVAGEEPPDLHYSSFNFSGFPYNSDERSHVSIGFTISSIAAAIMPRWMRRLLAWVAATGLVLFSAGVGYAPSMLKASEADTSRALVIAAICGGWLIIVDTILTPATERIAFPRRLLGWIAVAIGSFFAGAGGAIIGIPIMLVAWWLLRRT
jgi:hypothetical protein